MEVIVKKIEPNSKTNLFTGKGIKNPKASEVNKFTIKRLVLSGLDTDGIVTLLLEAKNFSAQATKSITLFSSYSVYSNTANSVVNESMTFTDSYTLTIESSQRLTAYLEYEVKKDDNFVRSFKINNE
tara:strand:+ start:172 stop:552 length:381 start_codon:yes stop_codon:yes gene_type:complete